MPLTDPRLLRSTVMALGVVPTATGLAALLRGTAIVQRGDLASIDSEHRFFAAWWTALGPLLWAVGPRAEERPRELQAVAATLFAGGVARLVALRQVGRPHPLYQGLAAVELTLPIGLVLWQRAVARQVRREPGLSGRGLSERRAEAAARGPG